MSTSPERGAGQGPAGGSRHTNEKDPVNQSAGGNPASERAVPTPGERVEEFAEEYPDRATLPVATPGATLRERYVEEEYREFVSEPPDGMEWETVEDREVSRREPVTVAEAIARSLEDHEDTRRAELVLEKWPVGEREPIEYRVSPDDRWSPTYQKRYFAELKAVMREFTGGVRPSGGETEAVFEEPKVALLGFTGSAVPGGGHIPPVDHANEVLGTREDRYHTLRNLMRSAGLELGEDWVYFRQSEPHDGKRGGGANEGYTHDHTVVVFDGAVADLEGREFAPLLEKHVEECELAELDAHRVEESVEVRDVEDLEDPAAYAAAYVSVEPSGLLERSSEYLMWAATMNAANLKVRTKSNAAKEAVRADACKQRCESAESRQDVAHGEHVRQERHRGERRLVCAECGSPHGVDGEYGTLVNARLSTGGGEVAVADGGTEEIGVEEGDGEVALGAWQDAEEVVSVGESVAVAEARSVVESVLEREPEASDPEVLVEVSRELSVPYPVAEKAVERVRADDEPEVVATGRLPKWHLVGVEVGDEVYPASAGSGVEMVETDAEPVWEMATAEWFEEGGRYRCECGVCAYGKAYLGHLAGYHGLETPEQAAAVTRRESVPGEEGEPVVSGGRISEGSGAETWLCEQEDCTCWNMVGNECAVCGREEPSGAVRA